MILLMDIDELESDFEAALSYVQGLGPAPATKHYLGRLCKRGHEWQGTGWSRRSRRNHMCMACEAEYAKARRARNKATDGERFLLTKR